MWEYYVCLKLRINDYLFGLRAPERNTKLTPLGTWKPLMTASDCKFLPLPITTGYNLKWCDWNEKAWAHKTATSVVGVCQTQPRLCGVLRTQITLMSLWCMRAKMASVRAFLCQQVTVDRALFVWVHCIASLVYRDSDLVDISLRLPPPMSAPHIVRERNQIET